MIKLYCFYDAAVHGHCKKLERVQCLPLPRARVHVNGSCCVLGPRVGCKMALGEKQAHRCPGRVKLVFLYPHNRQSRLRRHPQHNLLQCLRIPQRSGVEGPLQRCRHAKAHRPLHTLVHR